MVSEMIIKTYVAFLFYFFLQKTIAPTESEQQPTTGDESEELFLDGASNQTSTNSTND